MDSRRTLLQKRPLEREPLLLERYRLLNTLGEGGFGTVWHAHDELLQRHVAVKRIWIDPGGDSERAVREAKATARLKHPAIVALYEAVLLDDAFYLISELIHGQTLARLISADELSDEDVLEIGIALADALAHAHARGVVHRDIKPQNVLVPHEAAESAAKLTDFGGASLSGAEALTRTGDVFGTLAYMAPEQADGEEVGEEADLYSLALVLYEAFSGVNPVRGSTPAATARRIGSRLEPLARTRRDLPRALTHALDLALAPVPEDRATLERLRLALAETQDRGLHRSRWSRSRALLPAIQPPDAPAHTLLQSAPQRARHPRVPERRHEPIDHTPEQQLPLLEHPPRHDPGGRFALPRGLWVAAALALVLWQALAGRSGVALLLAAALAPLIALPGEHRSARLGWGWLTCALAPVLGLAALAGAYPALAAQQSRWRDRLAHGLLGYWWLTLAEPLLSRRLWLGAPSSTPARAIWESSLQSTASHVIAPMFSLAVLLGALLWGCAALVLPWIARGRIAVLDLAAVIVWSSALRAAEPLLDSALAAGTGAPSAHGAILGAIVGALFALAARALRGPV